VHGQEPLVFPMTTMVGALCRYVTTPHKDIQPMKANYGLLPPLGHSFSKGQARNMHARNMRVRNKQARHQQMTDRALSDLEAFMQAQNVASVSPAGVEDVSFQRR